MAFQFLYSTCSSNSWNSVPVIWKSISSSSMSNGGGDSSTLKSSISSFLGVSEPAFGPNLSWGWILPSDSWISRPCPVVNAGQFWLDMCAGRVLIGGGVRPKIYRRRRRDADDFFRRRSDFGVSRFWPYFRTFRRLINMNYFENNSRREELS